MVTGVLLATARIAGETAPLLFTALNNNFWFKPDLMGGVSNLPVMIYQFALAPYQNWRELAWAGRPHHHPVDPGAVHRGAPAPEEG